MTPTNSEQINFPVGFFQLHKTQIYNFNLNRWYSLGFTRLEDLQNLGKSIKTFDDWKKTMINLAEKAVSENRLMNAAFYYRASVFFLFENPSEKEALYDKYKEYFYSAFKQDKIEQIKVPYKEGFLPAMKIPAVGLSRGTILLHGGFDSFIEEWYLLMKYLAKAGYDVIGYEGPGQGAALIKYGLAFDIEWEKPVKVLLDYFKLDDVTLFGLSMGGWLCMRAAAFEPRIKRVITSGHAIDYMKIYPPFIRAMHLWLISKKNWSEFMDKMAAKKVNANNAQGWMTQQLMFITKKKDQPMRAFDTWVALNDENIHAANITQDVLVCSGQSDHIIPIKMHQMQLDALVNAKSVTSKIFTKEDQAQNHCQIGNIRLLLDTILDWLNGKLVENSSIKNKKI